MDIVISNASDRPIYEQIARQIKAHITAGRLSEGDALPSIRGLAKDLRISVITTKRAYDELEKEGYVHTVGGKGCYVAKRNALLLREENLRQIEAHMEAVDRLARACGLTAREVMEMLQTTLEASEK